MFSKAMISLFSISLGLFVSAGAWADSHHNGHDLVQDVHKAGTRIEFEEDQDEVYEAVREAIFALSRKCTRPLRTIFMVESLK